MQYTNTVPCAVASGRKCSKNGRIPKQGKLSISVKRIANNLVVKTKDDGLGMNMSDLPDILEGKKSVTKLYNTKVRFNKHNNTQVEV